ncbi:DegT/DnrJ/EryC1/StrS family aminotransferase [Actinoallomurus iriomotensis]|nr:DegT/DnrJ/EryC1/StrS family aminotransferase [Actinoallomurus iriomotensis]
MAPVHQHRTHHHRSGGRRLDLEDAGVMRIPLSSPSIGALESAFVSDAMSSGWISGSGPYLDRFQRGIARLTGRRHVLAVSSGTAALELALRALGVGPGDEVIVPALTFVSPAATVRTVGATPVMCDITPQDWTIDPALAASLVTDRTRAIIAVDLLGHPCDFDRLSELGVPLIEDAAQAHGAGYKGSPTGSFGNISIFSFHSNKTISTGEGGCAGTDDDELADRMRIIANHGMRPERRYWHEVVGHNMRMTNVTAAIGAAQLERWDELTARRNAVADRYRSSIADDAVGHRPIAPWARYSCWLHPVTVPDRDELVGELRSGGIDARAIWPSLPELPLYADGVRLPCPVAAEVSASTAWLPTWSHMPEEDTKTVVQALHDALAKRGH